MTLTARDEWDQERSKRVIDQLARKQAEVRTDEALNHLLEPFPIGAPPSFSMNSGKRGMEYRQAEISRISGSKAEDAQATRVGEARAGRTGESCRDHLCNAFAIRLMTDSSIPRRLHQHDF
ncbi:MAG: hypothetical protein K9N47_11935 [Prosthecobacter sp.]|nr:hypothetical protein [Prosthecobacter sp.]